MKNIQELFEKCKSVGIHQYGVISVKDVVFSPEVRHLCEVNQCGAYGTTWACPPGVGTLEECKEKCLKYENVFVFSTLCQIEDSFDFEGMMDGKKHHEEISTLVRKLFEQEVQDIMVLSSEGCSNCKKCAYPQEPCRYPDKMFPSVESYGIMVYNQAAKAGIKYMNGKNTVTYFSNIFYNEGETKHI